MRTEKRFALTIAMLKRIEGVQKGDLCPHCESQWNSSTASFVCGSKYQNKQGRWKLVATLLCLSRIRTLRPVNA